MEMVAKTNEAEPIEIERVGRLAEIELIRCAHGVPLEGD
jgi:hypothetical protein